MTYYTVSETIIGGQGTFVKSNPWTSGVVHFLQLIRWGLWHTFKVICKVYCAIFSLSVECHFGSFLHHICREAVVHLSAVFLTGSCCAYLCSISVWLYNWSISSVDLCDSLHWTSALWNERIAFVLLCHSCSRAIVIVVCQCCCCVDR